MDFKDLTPELREKAKACKTPQELMELAKSEGHKLTEEELEAIAGGGWGDGWCSTYLCAFYDSDE